MQHVRNTLGPFQKRDEDAKKLAKETETPRAAFRYDPKLKYNRLTYIGSMNLICPRCNAKKWKMESDTMCCPKDQTWERYPHLNELNEPLKSYYDETSRDSNHFLNNSRKYNNVFSMTSYQAANISREWSTFKVQGQVYHRIGSLRPQPDEQEKFLQIYFIDDYQKELQRRCNIIPGTEEHIVEDIQNYLHNNNSLVRRIKGALDDGVRNIHPDNFNIVICADKVPTGEHAGRYNAPTVDEVAAVVTGQDHGNRDIVINHRGEGLKFIKDTNHAYDALQYPLLYTTGEDGYDFGIKIFDEDGNPVRDRQGNIKTVSAMKYYAYMIMIRENQPNHLHKSRGLFQQFLTDMYVKIDSERVDYIIHHQTELH